MATYSFQDVSATIAGVGGVVDFGFNNAVASDGITIQLNGDRDVLTTGADGAYMHSLRCERSGVVTVRLMNTSPQNAALQAMFDAQSQNPTAWGTNLITIRNKGNDETTVCSGCAFKKQPDRAYAEAGADVEWVFNCGRIATVTGTYENA